MSEIENFTLHEKLTDCGNFFNNKNAIIDCYWLANVLIFTII
jgi:hypothetical protein